MKKRKFLICAVATAIALSSLFGCGGNKESGGSSLPSDKIPEAVAPAEDYKTHKIDGTLHEIDVDYESPVGKFAENGRTEYKIVAPSAYVSAAKFVAQHLNAATGAAFETVIADNYDLSSGKIIALGINDTIKSAVTVPTNDVLGNRGYYIKTVGDDVLVYCTTEDGAQLASIALLNALVGYDMLSGDCVIYEKSGNVLPSVEIKERPDFEYRVNSNTISDVAKYGMGFTMNTGIVKTKSGDSVHNLFDLFSESDKTSHPKWFSSDNVDLKNRIGQLCFTAHGDKDEYDKLVKKFVDEIESIIKDQPNVEIMRISQNDTVGANTLRRCGCTACSASYDYYGTLGGAILSLTNDVAKEINEYIAANCPERKFQLVVLIYGDAIQAPVKRSASGAYIYDENGKGIPETRYWFNESGERTAVKDENGDDKILTCENGVGYEYAASSANWIHSFYEDENYSYSSAVSAWAGLEGDLYIWSYEISYYQYLYPYNNYQIMIDNFKYFKEYGGIYMYPEGTWENPNNPGFAKLRDYINAKGMFNVNLDYNSLVDKFFKYYFREAAPYMRKYFDEVQANLSDKESITGGGVHSYDLAKSSVWPEGMITGWYNLFDKAQKAIEIYNGTDDELYEALSKHLLIESLFPRYVLCTTYADSYSPEQLKKMRTDFVNDFDTLGNTTHQEHYTISEVTGKWDID